MNSLQNDYFSHIRTEILPLVRSCERVLDIGCGEGRTAAWLKSQGLAQWAAGIEISPGAAAEAEKRLDAVAVLNIETEEIPFAEIDTVLCLDVLEHLRDPETALKKIVRVLRPGGSIIMSVPNVGNCRVVLPLLLGRWRYQDSGILDRTHLRFFDRKSAIGLVREASLEVEAVVTLPGDRLSAICDALSFGRIPLFHFQYMIHARLPISGRRADTN